MTDNPEESRARRIPSFNDFSPRILSGDLRPVLCLVEESGGDAHLLTRGIAKLLFAGATNKRSQINVPATLVSTGLCVRNPFRLTAHGRRVMDARDALAATQLFVKHIYEVLGGDVLVQAIRNISRRGIAGSFKLNLKRELDSLGIGNLSTATTDHTTLANWFCAAGVLKKFGRQWSVNDSVLKCLTGVSSEELEELLSLSEGQALFLRRLRIRAEHSPTERHAARDLIAQCVREAPDLYREDQFRHQVIAPLETRGWLVAMGLTRGRGAKSGDVQATPKLLEIPLQYYSDRLDAAIPRDLREHLSQPISQIRVWLEGADRYRRGLALELLALRMLGDLSVEPCRIRARGPETGWAEIDVLAESMAPVYCLWCVQCKRYSDAKVRLNDIAREVGVASVVHAQVVVVITTSGFTSEAQAFANTVGERMPMQVLLVDGAVIMRYLQQGARPLREWIAKAANTVRLHPRQNEDG
jgi:hypothetical protein